MVTLTSCCSFTRHASAGREHVYVLPSCTDLVGFKLLQPIFLISCAGTGNLGIIRIWRNHRSRRLQFIRLRTDLFYMMAVATPKGKQGTKGGKQIVEENATTLTFYRNMILGAVVIYFTLMGIYADGYNYSEIAWFFFAGTILSSGIQFMKFMAKPKYENKQLLDSGVDLNMEAGISEHVKDIIILTCTCLVLSCFSKYFWTLWLLVPLKGIYYAWSKLISPWIFAPAPDQTAQDEKKGKKMERRMRR